MPLSAEYWLVMRQEWHRGCTSGQALVGGAELSIGSWAFMFSIFAGGFAVAYFVRRQWI